MAEEKSEPNLTPILDMVFQLITFFMLVINFKNEESDRKMKLPVVGSAKPVDSKGQDRITVLNVTTVAGDDGAPIPAVKLFGRLYTLNGQRTQGGDKTIEGLLAGEKDVALKQAKPPLTEEDITTGGKELPDLVVIRADENCPFDTVDYVIHACQKNGFRRFGFKAFRTAEDQKKGTDSGNG